MFTLSNVLTLLRGPLAFLFLIDRVDVRASVLVIAMLSDFIDGYLARRYQITSRLGAILDPAMDKFFVLFVLSIFYVQNLLPGWAFFAMLSRDLANFCFAFYLLFKGKLTTYTLRPVIGGKIATGLQFIVLVFLTFGITISPFYYIAFLICGAGVLFELFYKELSMST